MTRTARPGQPIHGAPLGILMLDTRFTRIPGDMGNAATWPFPILFHVVRGASPERVVLGGAAGLLPAFIDGARELVALGAEAITTTCGFLALFQAELAAAVGVPVATSALLQYRQIAATLPPGERVGVLTVDARALGPAHLAAAGIPADIPMRGTEGGREFHRVLVRDESAVLDPALAEADLLEAGRALVAAHPEVGAILLECTNMPPHAAALRRALGRPVFDIHALVTWLHAGLRPRRFPPPD